LTFDASSAANAQITNNDIFAFQNGATADHANITNLHGSNATFDASTAASATITNAGNLLFTNVSSADHATITNADGALTFDASSAANAQITNNGTGLVLFQNGASADHATIANHNVIAVSSLASLDHAVITSDGQIFIQDSGSGGAAQLTMTSGTNSALDVSAVTTSTTLGSLEGTGNVFLGSKNLAVGGNNLSTTFAGVIQDGSIFVNGGTGGSLTKEGTGAFTLTGLNTYTGATLVNAGTLVVDGAIASSSGVTVNAGGTLAGTGTVSSTFVNDGGTLVAGHSDGTFGTLSVQGDLTFTAAATYLVQVSPATSGSTSVTGVATLGGGTVQANFTPGSYVTKQYGILNAAGGVTGTFNQLVATNLSPIFAASLSYDANNVFLNVDAKAGGLLALQSFSTNQKNVANALINSFNTVGGIPGAFATLQAPGLTQVSGEAAVGTQQATFDAMNQFMGVLLDPTAGGRSGAGANDAMAAMPRKAPAATPFSSRWGVWAAGFGGSQSVNGDTALGSNKTTSNVFGSAVGADYHFSPNTIAGFALAGGGTHFNVANGGSGNSDLFQAGAYLRHTEGAAFIAAALAYGWQDVTTTRNVTVAGIDSLRGRFNANALSGRLEGGYRVATAVTDVTPYAAGQFTNYRLPSYVEQVAFGASTFALSYGGKDVTASRTELGVKTENSFAQADSLLTLRSRLAWAHDYNNDRNVQAAFVTLPGAAFVVNGATSAADTALASLSAETVWRNGWAATATFDGQFSDTTRSYAGKGVVRYTW
jgi:autotransporter-associated beta strand protein